MSTFVNTHGTIHLKLVKLPWNPPISNDLLEKVYNFITQIIKT